LKEKKGLNSFNRFNFAKNPEKCFFKSLDVAQTPENERQLDVYTVQQ